MIDHVTIYVTDLLKSKRFYEKVFLPLIIRYPLEMRENFGHST
ncbi:VOC family protein [Legionella lytica]